MLRICFLLCCMGARSSVATFAEIPTTSMFLAANVPPVSAGTDSRLGFGYRLGEIADFQTIVELGPQLRTNDIGIDASDRSDKVYNNKRQATKQRHPKRANIGATSTPSPTSTTETLASQYLRRWAKRMKCTTESPPKRLQQWNKHPNQISEWRKMLRRFGFNI